MEALRFDLRCDLAKAVGAGRSVPFAETDPSLSDAET
jgi:hypothetical protein